MPVIVALRGGPADGKTVDLASLAETELDLEVSRDVSFGLAESVGGSQPLVSGHRMRSSALHRYRLVQTDPPVMQWVGQVSE